jgi:deoxycytidylate deaminase
MKLSGSWQRGFDAAEAASKLSSGPQYGYHLGAALYNGAVLLSLGCNNWNKTSPYARHATYIGNVHAEIMCLLKRKYYKPSKNLTLYVFRSTSNSKKTYNKPACSRPCRNCMKIIAAAGVHRVRFYNECGNPREIRVY